MSAVLRLGIGAAAIALSAIALTNALAQRAVNPSEPGDVKPAPTQIDVVPPLGQTDRAGAVQSDGNRFQSDRIIQPRQPYTANFRGTQNAGQLSQAVEQYLTNCLLKNNQAEIELSQFVQQRTQNPTVKQFAAQLERDHQQLAQKIEQATGMRSATKQNTQSELGANASGVDRTTLGATGGRKTATSSTQLRPAHLRRPQPIQ